MAIIYAFGDSITYGAWDVQTSGWAAQLRKYFDDLQENNPEYYGLFYNLGIPGETTAGLLKRFETETAARERDGEDAMFIFAFGANDAAYLPKENKFRVSKEDFKTNLTQVIQQASNISENILLINILPVVEKVTCTPKNGKIRLNKYMTEYNLALSELADQFELPLIDVFSAFMNANHEDLFITEDGLHPNEEGHKLMFDTIKPIVQRLIGWK